jgi:glycosyltransferase involved in cell wall biosynthesis
MNTKINEKTAVKLLFESYEFQSRDKREVSVLSQIFNKVIVVEYGNTELLSKVGNIDIITRKKKYSKNSFIRKFQILYKILYQEPKFICSLNPIVISCHDLKALFIGWVATLFFKNGNKPKLVYDSHEFELGRNTIKPRSFINTFLIKIIENFLIKKCIFSIMVNKSIADEVQKIHNLKKYPIVVRNVPKKWTLNSKEILKTRMYLNSCFQDSKDKFLLLYHGNVFQGRGIENLIDVIFFDQSLILFILGNSDDEKYIDHLKMLARDKNVLNRVVFHRAVSYEFLKDFIPAADIGMVTFQAVSKSYYYGLPNKFFECIQGLTPVVCSDYPEISSLVKLYDIGLCVDPFNTKEIFDAVIKIKNDKDVYLKYKRNLLKAKNELNWENESIILINAYKEFF